MPKVKRFDANMVMNTGPRVLSSTTTSLNTLEVWDTHVECIGDTNFTVTLPNVSEAAGNMYTMWVSGTADVKLTDAGDEAQYSDITVTGQNKVICVRSVGKRWTVLRST